MSVVYGSAIVQWLLRALAILETACRESLIGKTAAFCVRVGKTLGNWLQESGLYRFLFVDGLIARLLRAIGRWVSGSAVCRLVWRDGRVIDLWKGSVLRTVLTALANLPGAVVGWVYRRTKGGWESSLLLKGVSDLGAKTHILLGLLLLGIMVIDHSRWDNMYAFLGVVLLCVLFVVGGATRTGLRFSVTELGPYVILNMVVICWSVLTSMDVGGSLRFFVFQMTAFLMMLLLIGSVKDYRQLQIIVVLAMVGITAASLYGCYQGIVGVEVSASQTDLSLNAGMPGRIYSFFDNPNAFGGILVMAVPLTFALILNSKTWIGRGTALLSLLICVIALLQTYSRAGWIGFAVSVVVFAALWNWRCIPALIIVGIGCLPILPDSIFNRILTIGNTADSSTSYRFSIYQATIRLLKVYGLRGVGLGSNVLHEAFKLFPPMYNGAYPVHSHCTYLQIWAETGIFGLLTFLGAMIHQGKRAVKAYCFGGNRRVKLMMAAALAGLCGILVMGLVEYVWFYTRSLYFFWFLFAILVTCIKIAHTTEE